jgi:hypothetical protein
MPVRVLTMSLWTVALTSIACTLLPFLLVAPFHSQTAFKLQLSYTLDHWAPVVTLLLLMTGIALATMIWRRGAGIISRLGVVIGCSVLILLAYAAQLRPAEIMFAQLREVVRIPADQAGYVATEDLVLGVTAGDESAAYPVPIIAYHHIVNDRLADEPYVVTY